MKGQDLDAFFAPITEALVQLPDEINVIAEPGRFLVASAVTGVCSVSGRARRGDYQWYYLDDGIYGSYSGQLFDHVLYPLQILNDTGPRYASILAGPTCDSIDIVAEDVQLPLLEEGDLVVGHMMGAYTHATATRFNSLSGAKVVFVDE
jgi:ornithine decarboxylase